MQPISKRTMNAIRDNIDFIHGLTSGEDGYTGSLHDIGGRVYEITREMLSRGVLIKSYVGKGKKLYNYRWNVNAMAPTNEFYKSIAKAVIKHERDAHTRRREQAKSNLPVVPETIREDSTSKTQDTLFHQENQILPLAGFTSGELWDELKRRGATIEDNRIVLCIKEYLN